MTWAFMRLVDRCIWNQKRGRPTTTATRQMVDSTVAVTREARDILDVVQRQLGEEGVGGLGIYGIWK